MKQLSLLISFLVCTLFTFGQIDSLKVMPYGFSNAAQTITPNLAKAQILAKAKAWVNKTYQNPDKVVSGFTIDGTLNEHFIVNGYAENAFYYKNYNQQYDVNVKYHIDITVKDSILIFQLNIDEMYSPKCVAANSHTMCDITFSGLLGFYTKKGVLRDYWLKTNAINDFESHVNNLLFSLANTLSAGYTSDEALAELKKWKDKLDLGLITQVEFDAKKAELSKYIK